MTNLITRRTAALWIATLLVLGNAAFAETTTEPCDCGCTEDNGGPFSLSLLWENDSDAFNPFNSSDRHYTNGVEAVIAGHPKLADDFADLVPTLWGDFEKGRTAAGLVGGQLMFTPRNRDLTAIDPNDRPYAGWLYGGGFVQRAGDHVFDHMELDLGVVGPSSLAQNAQDMIHGLFGVEKFQGWGNQLKDEAEFNVEFERRWKTDPVDIIKDKIEMDLIPQAGLRLGTVYRDAEVGATLRIGWQLGDDFGPGNISHAIDYTVTQHNPTVYAFARADGRFVEHNTFIQGNQFRDSFGVDPEPVVGEVTVGLVIETCRYVQFVYSQTYMTHEFKGQSTFDSYGTYLLTVHFDF